MNISDELIFRAFLADRSDLRADGAVEFVRFEENASHGNKIYGFNSRMSFGRIVYTKDGRQLTTDSLAIKQTPAVSWDQHHCQLQFANEIYFYSKLLPFFEATVYPSLSSFFPKFLYSFSRNTPTQEHVAVIFENLRDRGFVEHQRASSILLDYSHMRLVMRRLGEFHGYSLAAAKLNPSRFQQLANFLPRIHERCLIGFSSMTQAYLNHSVQLLTSRDQRYAARLKPLEKISRNMIEYLRTVNEGTTLEVVCHGDLLTTNLLFRYENGVPVDVKALDMGLWRLASPVLDLALALYVSADQQARDQHWDDMLADYCRGMAEVVGAKHIPTMEAIVEEFRRHCWFGIIIADHSIRDLQGRFENSIRFFDIFGGKSMRADETTAEEIMKKLEDSGFGGAVATEMVISVMKDMIARNFI